MAGIAVKLLSLKDIEENDNFGKLFLIPILINRNLKFTHIDIGEMSISEYCIEKNTLIDTSSKQFTIGEQTNLHSLDEIISFILNRNKYIFNKPGEIYSLPTIVEIVINDKYEKYWFHYNENKFLIKDWTIKVETSSEIEKIPIPVGNLVYHQEFNDGVLAWISRTEFFHNNQMYEINIIMKPNDDGSFTLQTCNISNS